MTTVNYSYSRTYSGNRPYADIVLIGQTAHSNLPFKALVDTGADYLQLPLLAANKAGLNLSLAKTKSVKLAVGLVSMTFLSGVEVEVEGKLVKVDVLFDHSGSTNALLGREALLAALEAGFNASEWLWKF
jgi:predicted aspartyl protease